LLIIFDLFSALTSKWKKQHTETLAKTGGQPAALLSTSHENLLRFQSKQGQAFVFDKIKEEKMRGVLRTGQVWKLIISCFSVIFWFSSFQSFICKIFWGFQTHKTDPSIFLISVSSFLSGCRVCI
jgi:hypothetical protein